MVALDPSEEVYISRRFRTFTGPYVAHCHNLAHEDHNMMFGWEILPPNAYVLEKRPATDCASGHRGAAPPLLAGGGAAF